MAVNNVNYNDSLREGTDKINQSIDQSNQAIDKANSADTKADSAISTANQANTKSDDTQQQLNNIVINNGESDAEVLQARGSYSVLNERLSATDEQLAEEAQKVDKIVDGNNQGESINLTGGMRLGVRPKKPIITFTSDDGRVEDYTRMKSLFATKGIPLTMGIIADGNYGNGVRMSVSQINELLGMGWEITSHTATHPILSNLTDQQIDDELKNSKQSLEQTFGVPIKHILYPYGAHDERVRKTARKYYRSGASTNPGNNSAVHKTYALNRVALGSYFDPAQSGYPATNTLEYYKQRVDEAITNNSWLIFMLHTWSPEHDATQQQYISELIDYIQSKNILITTMEDAMNQVGNLMDVGDHGSEEYFAIGSAGKTETNFAYKKRSSSGLSATSPLSSFEKNMVTSIPFTVGDNGGFPENAGILETYNLSGADFAFQLFNHYDSEKVYRRRWVVSSNSWSKWSIMNPSVISSDTNAYTSSSSWAVFPFNKIVSTKITTEGANGFPNNVAGLLVTNSLTREVGYTRQTYYVFNNSIQYERYAMSDGSWSSWERISKRLYEGTFNNFSFGTIPANGQVEQTFTISGVKTSDNVIVNPRGSVENGLMWNSYVSATDTIVVRVVNVTTSNIVTSPRLWSINVSR